MVSRGSAIAIGVVVLLMGAPKIGASGPPGGQSSGAQSASGLVQAALAALSGGTSLSDATLQATVTYTAGSDAETGTATLEALGDADGLVMLTLSGGAREWIRNGAAGVWSGPDGLVYAMALHNCWTDAAWFFPGLVLADLASNPQIGLVNLGAATWNGAPANEVQFYQLVSGQAADVTALVQGFSTEEVYLDPVSALPLAIDFNAHPDNNAGANIPVEIQFSNYQQVSGISVPFHVQYLLNGSLLLDINVTSAAANTGIPASTFTLPPATGGTQ